VIRAAALGVAAAVVAPACTRAAILERLLEPPRRIDRTPAAPGLTRTALRASHRALRWLGRLRRLRGPWRNRCLHRSVAACLVLRRLGVPAVLRIGVRIAGGREVEAHAWVEGPDGTRIHGSPLEHCRMGRSRASVTGVRIA
jgi:hypothetical protein